MLKDGKPLFQPLNSCQANFDWNMHIHVMESPPVVVVWMVADSVIAAQNMC